MRLFEFGDLENVPVLHHLYLRRYMVFFYKVFGYYKLWVPGFSDFIKKTHAQKFMECCSGAGEPLELIDAQLDSSEVGNISYLLSDMKPNQEYLDKFNKDESRRFHYIEHSVDATADQQDYDFPKIFINSFHHFSSEQVEKILDNNFSRKNEIIIMEYVRNTLMGYLTMILGPIFVLLTLPFVVKLKDLPIMAFFTYIVPLFPLMLLWDGFVSCLHEYSEEDLSSIVKKLKYNVEITADIKRNFLYPAGVSIITFTFPDKAV